MEARLIRSGEAELLIAGGAESMSRAPFVIGKADMAYARDLQFHDTTMGWRFVNPLRRQHCGAESMPVPVPQKQGDAVSVLLEHVS